MERRQADKNWAYTYLKKLIEEEEIKKYLMCMCKNWPTYLNVIAKELSL